MTPVEEGQSIGTAGGTKSREKAKKKTAKKGAGKWFMVLFFLHFKGYKG
jgi:hypothetical protein